TMLLFFLSLGLTNLAKGLLFGTVMVLVPLGGFLVWQGDRSRFRRYLWLWGWLVFLAVGLTWPLAAYLRFPAIQELWLEHYLGRVCQGFLQQPWWYYLVTLPLVILPWTGAALVGLVQLQREARSMPCASARFLCCAALLPPLVLSLPQAKHHHYLLHCL